MRRFRDLDLLRNAGIRLVLVDIGASFGPFEPFRPLLPAAVYLGFDPDQRETQERTDTKFHRFIIINKAVVPDSNNSRVHFYLTKHPACSSTLRPRQSLLKNYFAADRFHIINEIEVGAITLNDALTETKLGHIDWIKLDTQGTDLRLIESIDAKIAGDIMAIDAEPGFDAYYDGEDTFGELHHRMVERGFWLADLDVGGQIRAPRETLERVFAVRGKVARKLRELTLKASPTAAKARYLRTLESLIERGAGSDAYLRLWACAFYSANYPYALHVLQACAERWPEETERLDHLHRATVRRLKASALRTAPQILKKLSWRNVQRLMWKEY